MILRVVTFLVVAGFSLLYAAESNTLEGTVKDAADKGIEGVKISLVKLQDATATTDATGAFSVDISGGVGVAVPHSMSIDNMRHFGVQGKALQFRLDAGCNNASVSVFRGSGQLVSTMEMGRLRMGMQKQVLPELVSGFYVVQVSIDGHITNLNLLTTGREYFIDDASAATSNRKPVMATAAANEAVDTVVATKSGYETSKVAITSYTLKNVAVIMKKAGPIECKLSNLPEPSALKANQKLPNPFAFFDGTEITKKSEWPCLRKEILNMAYKYMYGQMPPFEAPDVEVEGTVSGSGVTAKITYKEKSATIDFGTSGSGDILLISMGSGLAPGSGYSYRTFSVDNSKANSWASTCKNLFGMNPCGEISIGWGCNILCRAIASDPDGGIDTNKIMTTGCSNTAKAAFLSAAFCEGIDLAVVVESGGFGDASPRVAEYLYKGPGPWKCNDPPQGLWSPDEGGQWLAGPYMDPNVASWVIKNNSGNVYKLPYDHHMLMACVAPRALCVCSNSNGPNSWCHLNGTGSAVAAWAAKPVFNALGVPENFAFNIPAAYSHCSGAQQAHGSLVNEFFKRVFDGDKNAKTDVMNIPASNVQLDPSKWKEIWVDWNMEKTLE
jgi:hypothetical protein